MSDFKPGDVVRHGDTVKVVEVQNGYVCFVDGSYGWAAKCTLVSRAEPEPLFRREWDAVARAEIATLREAATLRERISDACDVLAAAGCSCECGHDSEGHDDDCERCLGCRVEAVLT